MVNDKIYLKVHWVQQGWRSVAFDSGPVSWWVEFVLALLAQRVFPRALRFPPTPPPHPQKPTFSNSNSTKRSRITKTS